MDVAKLFTLALLCLALTQCGASASSPASSQNEGADGKTIFSTLCAQCHGLDGKKGVGGAKDLTATTLAKGEIEDIIRIGKGTMPAYGKSVNDTEISAVAEYVLMLKQ